MYYIHYNEENGEILGIYPSSEAFDDVPEPKIAITDEELEKISEGYYIVQNSKLVEIDPDYEIDTPPAPSSDDEGEIDTPPAPPSGDEEEFDNPPDIPAQEDNPSAPNAANVDENNSDTNTSAVIEKLQSEYGKRFEKLKRAYLGAAIMDNNYTAEAIQRDYEALLHEFTRKVIDIEESSSIVTTNDYCEICGSLTAGGVCTNCRWRQ